MAKRVHVALLRGINLGGKHRLPMAELVEMFTAAGCTEVRTYIQSGNVVFQAGAALARKVPELVGRAIAEGYGFEVPMVTRTAAELERIIDNNPFLERAAEPKALHVMFLRDRPSEAAVEALDPDRSPPDEFGVRGRHIYLRCPNGVARSKLTNQYFDSKLETVSTSRNWNTVLKLREMAAAEA
jgi:uncharacterized protein (DUF1697 family)